MKIWFNIIVLSVILISCKTTENGYTKIPQQRYDINKIKQDKLQNISLNNDTAIILELNCSGMCIRGIENNLFILRKNGNITEIDRISNLRKFQIYKSTEPIINWDNILFNIQLYIKDTIFPYKKIIGDDNRIYIVEAGSDGKTQQMDILFGKIKHNVYLAPFVDSYNKNNINLKLIIKLTNIVYNIPWVATEKIKYKMER